MYTFHLLQPGRGFKGRSGKCGECTPELKNHTEQGSEGGDMFPLAILTDALNACQPAFGLLHAEDNKPGQQGQMGDNKVRQVYRNNANLWHRQSTFTKRLHILMVLLMHRLGVSRFE